jgi:hypothetical protein
LLNITNSASDGKPFSAMHESAPVQVFGRLHDDPIHTRRREASEKRQCRKSRDVEQVGAARTMAI